MLDREDVVRRLERLNEQIYAELGVSDALPEIVLVGGSALLLKDCTRIPRPTSDIDALMVDKRIVHLLAEWDINDDANTFLFRFPMGWENRKEALKLDLDCLRVYVPSNEDLFIAKAIAGRENDMQDIASMLGKDSVNLKTVEAILQDPGEVFLNVEDEVWEKLQINLEKVIEKGTIDATPRFQQMDEEIHPGARRAGEVQSKRGHGTRPR